MILLYFEVSVRQKRREFDGFDLQMTQTLNLGAETGIEKRSHLLYPPSLTALSDKSLET